MREASVMEHFQDGNKTNIHLFQIRNSWSVYAKWWPVSCMLFLPSQQSVQIYTIQFSHLTLIRFYKFGAVFGLPSRHKIPAPQGAEDQFDKNLVLKRLSQASPNNRVNSETQTWMLLIYLWDAALCQVSCILMLTTCDDINMEQQNMEFDRKWSAVAYNEVIEATPTDTSYKEWNNRSKNEQSVWLEKQKLYKQNLEWQVRLIFLSTDQQHLFIHL